MALGVGGAVLLALGSTAAYWGALLYMLAQFVDHMDGELPLGSDLNVADKLVNHGKVHLGKHRLILHKHYQANKGKFVGDKEGIIIVKGNGDIDTIVFDSAKAHLKTLKLERDTNKPVMLGSNLEVDSLVDLTKGKIKLIKGMLRLHKKAKFAHVDSNNYIVITPGAKLARRPDSLKHPILFPIGNDSIYTPAELIQKAGSDTNEFTLAISDRVRAGGETGNDISHTRIVKKTWHIETQGVDITVKIKIVWSVEV
ncbi:MAG: hypothetical protein MI922_20575, partial [Bacteroidales bacterium]|nr:hypothetical protein [Bacteroidales bacterium]